MSHLCTVKIQPLGLFPTSISSFLPFFLPPLCCVGIPNSCNVIHFNTNKSENAAFFDSGEMAFKYTCAILLLSVLLSTKAKQLRNNPSHPAKGIALMTIDNFSHFYIDFNSNRKACSDDLD